MSEIKKLLFSVSEKGNPICNLWVDESDINKNSDSYIIGIKSQVAYLLFQGIGAQVELKKSKQYYNVVVPDMFTNLFDNYKTSPDNTVKFLGMMLNNAFDNAFKSLEYLKTGEITKVSQEECNAMCSEYLTGFFNLYDNVVENLSKSNNKALKTVAKTLSSDTSKPADIKEANHVALNYVNVVNNYLNKQHIKVE